MRWAAAFARSIRGASASISRVRSRKETARAMSCSTTRSSGFGLAAVSHACCAASARCASVSQSEAAFASASSKVQSDLDEFVHECWEAAGCFARPAEAEAQIAALEEKLLAPPPIALALHRQDVDHVDHRADDVDYVDRRVDVDDHADDDDSDYDWA
jgi:hypothetical protein